SRRTSPRPPLEEIASEGSFTSQHPAALRRRPVKLVGLTGGVGSGKSTVGEMLRELGAEVVDADAATHAVYEPGGPGYDAVVREFGPDFVRDGKIDRSKLGDLVFRDADARRRLNAIVHP